MAGAYAFAEVPTHEDGLAAPVGVGANRREETKSALAVGVSLAAARLAESRANHAVSFHNDDACAADLAVQKARDVVFDVDAAQSNARSNDDGDGDDVDAPDTKNKRDFLSQVHASALEVARAKSKVYDRAREQFTERERHLADLASQHTQRVVDAAHRKRANHVEWLRQDATRRNKNAIAEEEAHAEWYRQAERVRAFEMAKMDLESGRGGGGSRVGDENGHGNGPGGTIRKMLLPAKWLWEKWGGARTAAEPGEGECVPDGGEKAYVASTFVVTHTPKSVHPPYTHVVGFFFSLPYSQSLSRTNPSLRQRNACR